MNDGNSIMIIVVFPVNRQMQVLIWRHEKRQQQSKGGWEHNNATHGARLCTTERRDSNPFRCYVAETMA